MSNIKASIIIPTKDKFTRLRLILETLKYQMNEDVEVIVVFDGCRPEIITEFDRLQLSYHPKKIICERNVGRAAARNLGLWAARGEIVIFLDDDRIPAPDFVSKHLAGHEKRCVIIGERKQLDLSEAEIEMFVTEFQLDRLQEIYKKAYVEFFNNLTKKVLLAPNSHFRWLGLATGNVSMAREDLIKVGGFDENFTGWGYEDIELGYRLFREKIPFIKDSSIVNYHLMHEHGHGKNHEEFRNIKYFLTKIKGDFIPRTILRLLLFRVNIRVLFKL
jgi:glycosyltransferase involved in cell wall biosynthesis